jgi:hypothetical protein
VAYEDVTLHKDFHFRRVWNTMQNYYVKTLTNR